jgi:hypothetical protein
MSAQPGRADVHKHAVLCESSDSCLQKIMFDASFSILTAQTLARQLEIRPLKVCRGRIDSETERICRHSEMHQQGNEKLLSRRKY